MSKIRKSGIYFSLVLLVITISSFKAFSPSENSIYKKKWIPEDFDPTKVTLLITKHPYPKKEKWNTAMVEYIQKEYPWKYEIVAEEDLQNEKYQDKKNYQFALVWTQSAQQSGGTGSHLVGYDVEGHFLDRSNDKSYPNSGYSLNRGVTSYKKILTVLIKKFKDGKED